MQTNEHYYSLTKDEYMSLSAGDMGTLDGLKMKAEYKVKQAYSALAEVLVAEESVKDEDTSDKWNNQITEDFNLSPPEYDLLD